MFPFRAHRPTAPVVMADSATLTALALAFTAALSHDREMRAAEAAVARRADAEERAADAALRYVQVRSWEGPLASVVKLRRTFGAFFAEALAAVRAFGAARLYTLGEEGDWRARQPLTEGASYAALLDLAASPGALLPDILVYELLPSSETSPQAPPAAAAHDGAAPGAEAAAAAPANVPADGCSSASSARSTSLQSAFRRSLQARDGEGAPCAVCGEGPTDAAHILPRTSSTAELLSAHLLSTAFPSAGPATCCTTPLCGIFCLRGALWWQRPCCRKLSAGSSGGRGQGGGSGCRLLRRQCSWAGGPQSQCGWPPLRALQARRARAALTPRRTPFSASGAAGAARPIGALRATTAARPRWAR